MSSYTTINSTEDIDNILTTSLQSIINAFHYQRDKYISIIQSQQTKISTLNQQIETLQLQNQSISFQLESLKQKLHSISSSPLTSNNIQEEDYSLLYKLPQKETTYTYDPIPIKNYPNVVSKQSKQISNSNSFLTNRTNKTNLTIQTETHNNSPYHKHQRNNNSKYNSIQQRINSLRSYNTHSNSQSKLFNKSTSSDEEEILNVHTNRTSNRNEILIEGTQHQNSYGNPNITKSKQYQNTNNFIKECKLALNASNFEKLLKVFKEHKGNNDESTNELKLKAKDILKGNTKLQMMFDGIYG